ncbi:chromosome segregation protein SMC [Woodsholea maritima]|uniref:chromosome segregation protein SMC n=1 Tax=Woodsholea maritima TaxID=240237 RepID=UPI0003678978|nr:chromosome segregation protein SMC [Woodsholea maritima]
MQFTQLRLAGFKSFVDPAMLHIDPGLTGIIGPNGCGKSNLLEALRWVMGATSAKSLRGGEMDDVIFAGTDKRPSRDRAEVTLWVDNSDKRAPARFNDADTLEIIRRIVRGQGSNYKINGEEVRAKDVHLLFADAGTGANSPALVRQGQISELIGAKPQNRRQILEEAAGVSGLRARRKEAELRLKAAETNLERLQDVVDGLNAQYNALQRQAKQAGRYRELSQSLRHFEILIWVHRLEEAASHIETAQSDSEACEKAVQSALVAQANATHRTEALISSLDPLRTLERETSAAQREIEKERDRLERDEAEARATLTRLEARLGELDKALGRERDLTQEAQHSLDRLNRAIARLVEEQQGEGPALQRANAATLHAEKQRADAEKLLDARASEGAQAKAAFESAQRESRQADHRLTRLHTDLSQVERQIETLKSQGAGDIPALEAQLNQHRTALDQARQHLEALEAERPELEHKVRSGDDAARDASGELSALEKEKTSLERLLVRADEGFSPILDHVRAQPGYEKALAAALGEDLNAALDPHAPRYWRLGASCAASLPEGVAHLGQFVDAPAELAARLSAIGVVEVEEFEALSHQLKTGQRLVTREGALARWDGFMQSASAPSAAAARLETQNRVKALEGDISRATRLRDETRDTLSRLRAQLNAHQEALNTARNAAKAAEQTLRTQEAHFNQEQTRLARQEAQLHSAAFNQSQITDQIAQAKTELSEAQARMVAAQTALPAPDGVERAREAADRARAAAADTRAALESLKREAQSRAHRLKALERERDDWQARQDKAHSHMQAAQAERTETEAAFAAAMDKPEQCAGARNALLERLVKAESDARHARDQVVRAEADLREADLHLRQAEKEAGSAREKRAVAVEKLKNARERLNDLMEEAEDTIGEPPAKLAQEAQNSEFAHLSASELDRRVRELREARERLGAVNLRAEEEATTLDEERQNLITERDDLIEAVARLRKAVDTLSREGRARLLEAFDVVHGHFKDLFVTLFGGGHAELRLTEHDDPLEAGLEIFACPPGKKLDNMNLMSGGEQALTAAALIFAVFLSNPAPVCVLDEVDAPLDDANVDRFCRMLEHMRTLTKTRFLTITHNPVTMARMDRLFGVTMGERGVSQLVSVDLKAAEKLLAAE